MLTESPETVTPPAAVGTFRFLAVPLLHPSPTNPRRHAHPEADAELVASVRAVGILEPLIVRPTDAHDPDNYTYYEIVAGHRRFAAGKAAGLWEVPCVIRELSDVQALEIAVTENNQRQDVHPLDEAEAFERLIRTTGTTEEQLAARLGRPRRYVVERLRLLQLTTPVMTAFEADVITLGHAQVLARLKPEDQNEALKACFDEHLNYEDEDGEATRVLKPVHELQFHINRTIRLDLAAPDTQETFPELVQEVAEATAAGATVLAVSEEYGSYNKPAADGEPISHYWWDECAASEPGAQRAVIVQGRRRGKLLWVLVRQPGAKEGSAASPKAKKTAVEKEADRKAREKEEQRLVAQKAIDGRKGEVYRRAAVQVVNAVTVDGGLVYAPQLRALCSALVGLENFDSDVLDAVCAELKVPAEVFRFSGEKARLKLPAPKLAALAAVMAIGVDSYGDPADAFSAFGVNVKAIDKAVAKEQAVAEKPAKKGAKKR